MKKLIKRFKEFKEKKTNAKVTARKELLETVSSYAKHQSELYVLFREATALSESIRDDLLAIKMECIVDKKIEDLHDTFMAELAKHNIEKHGEEVLDYDKLFDKKEE